MIVLAYDLGGTKVAVGAVDSRGKILDEIRVPVALDQGKAATLRQLVELGREILERNPSIKKAGIGSAGPLDPVAGTLLDPTNFVRNGKRWGKVSLGKILGAKLGIPVRLDNDAAAAMLAEHWIGAAQGYDNAMILTLGTGLGTGIIANGELVRAGRHLHPEDGHFILRAGDKTALCGCGNYGCAEAFLSGGGFGRRARLLLKDKTLDAKIVAERARAGNAKAKALFREYAELMAVAIHNYVMAYAPEIVVFTGSFANASSLFLPDTRKHLAHLLRHKRVGVDMMPKLAVSKLEGQAGLIGAAVIGMRES